MREANYVFTGRGKSLPKIVAFLDKAERMGIPREKIFDRLGRKIDIEGDQILSSITSEMWFDDLKIKALSESLRVYQITDLEVDYSSNKILNFVPSSVMEQYSIQKSEKVIKNIVIIISEKNNYKKIREFANDLRLGRTGLHDILALYDANVDVVGLLGKNPVCIQETTGYVDDNGKQALSFSQVGKMRNMFAMSLSGDEMIYSNCCGYIFEAPNF